MARLPLAGTRIVDFSWVMAGPVMTSMLADLGAEVIKIESRARMDGMRSGRPLVGDVAAGDKGAAPEVQPFQHAMHRNKLGVTLNLAQPLGIRLAKELIAKSHVVTENFSAGTMDKLGLGYDTLRELNPSLVFVSISAAGQQGPMSSAVTYNPVAVALSGLGSLLGYEDEAPLGVMRNFFGDTSAGIQGAVAALGAIYRARRTGVGGHVDLSQWEAAAYGLDFQFLSAQVEQTKPVAMGSAHPWLAPHGNYPAAGKPNWSWIAISCATDQQWLDLCVILGLDDLAADPGLLGAAGRYARRRELDERIAQATTAFDKHELAQRLQAVGVRALPVMDVSDQFESEHFRSRGIHVEAHHSAVGYEIVQSLPWRTSRIGRGEFRSPAPTLGRDNAKVFGEILGLSESEIGTLENDRVIY